MKKTLASTLFTLAALTLALPPSTGFAEGHDKPTKVVEPRAEVLVRARRFELKDFTADTNEHTIRQRVRAGLWLNLGHVGAVVQIQDIRFWGEERNTLGDFSADGLDLHQGFATLKPAEGLELRIGRQEIWIENHRIIGTVGWLEQARSFDALRLRYNKGDLHGDIFFAKVAEEAVQGGELHPFDVDLLSLSGRYDASKMAGLALMVVVDSAKLGDERTRTTIGGRVGGKLGGGISYDVEGYFQVGELNLDDGPEAQQTIQAFLLGARLRADFPVASKPAIEAFGDFVSGDDDPSDRTVKAFDTLFATNHKFYGEMDIFLNLPVNTSQRGLMDVGLRAWDSPGESVKLIATYHHFRAMASGESGLDIFGDEVDLKAIWKIAPGLTLDAMVGIFLPGDIFKDERGDEAERFFYTTWRQVF